MSVDPVRHEPPAPGRSEVRPGPRVPPHDRADLPPPPRDDLGAILDGLDQLRRIAGAERYRSDAAYQIHRASLKRWESYLEARLRRGPDEDASRLVLERVRIHLGRRP